MNKDLNRVSYEFQKKIVNIFNQEQLPFLLKYYLFKEIWETLKIEKNNFDIQMQMTDEEKEEVITKEIELPQDFLDNIKKSNE